MSRNMRLVSPLGNRTADHPATKSLWQVVKTFGLPTHHLVKWNMGHVLEVVKLQQIVARPEIPFHRYNRPPTSR